MRNLSVSKASESESDDDYGAEQSEEPSEDDQQRDFDLSTTLARETA